MNCLPSNRHSNVVNKRRNGLLVTDLDFSDLTAEDDTDILLPSMTAVQSGCIPPPPPPPMMTRCRSVSPTPSTVSRTSCTVKKTVKLFWKEVKEDKALLSLLTKEKTIWDEIKPVPIDVQKFEHLFENRSKEIINKKNQDSKKSEILVLDAKRSNAINIGMTKLPPPRVLKTAIIEMNSRLISKESVEKILSMMPTPTEINMITEAKRSNPLLPLGSAESFLMILSSIPALEERLRLWLFRLDFQSSERECAEQLMDLKTAMHDICNDSTFKTILATLLSLGNFLNNVQCKGFQLDYLSKVSEVKDTLTKHSLVYHVACLVLEKDESSSDLFSGFGSVCRASNIDFEHLTKSVNKLEEECKACLVRLKIICKSQVPNEERNRINELTDFLNDCQKRISVLHVVYRRVLNRYKKTLVYLGFDSASVRQLSPNEFFRIIKDFALDYKNNYEKSKKDRTTSDYESDLSSSGTLSKWSPLSSRLSRCKSLGNIYCSDHGLVKNQDDDIIDFLVKSSTHTSAFQRKRMSRLRKQSSSASSTSSNISNLNEAINKTDTDFPSSNHVDNNNLEDPGEDIMDALCKTTTGMSLRRRPQRTRKQPSFTSSTVSSVSSVLSSISISSSSSQDSDILEEPSKHSKSCEYPFSLFPDTKSIRLFLCRKLMVAVYLDICDDEQIDEDHFIHPVSYPSVVRTTDLYYRPTFRCVLEASSWDHPHRVYYFIAATPTMIPCASSSLQTRSPKGFLLRQRKRIFWHLCEKTPTPWLTARKLFEKLLKETIVVQK